MKKYVFFNGRITPHETIHFGLSDLGLLRGYSMFDYMPIKEKRVVFVEDYLGRFYNSAKSLNIKIPYSSTEIIAHLSRLIDANEMTDGYCRFLLTAGYAQDGYTPHEDTPNFLMILYPPVSYPKELFEQGVKLMTVDHVRPMAEVKTTNYLRAMIERPRLIQTKAFDVLFVQEGFISESSRSNFFMVDKDGVICTPSSNVLKGITRKKLIEIAQRSMGCVERPIQLEELRYAKEAFITSTTKATLSVVQLDDWIIGDGRPGDISKELRHLYAAEVDNYLATVSAATEEGKQLRQQHLRNGQ